MHANKPTAAQTYAARRNDIARLLDVLQMELDRHAERAKAEPDHWGYAGDLGETRRILIDVVARHSGMEISEVERFLAE